MRAIFRGPLARAETRIQPQHHRHPAVLQFAMRSAWTWSVSSEWASRFARHVDFCDAADLGDTRPERDVLVGVPTVRIVRRGRPQP